MIQYLGSEYNMDIYGSILNTVKIGIGYEPDYTPFDFELILYINSVLRTLNQFGVGENRFSVTSDKETWVDFLGTTVGADKFSEVQTYTILKVKLMHDPPSNSFLIDSINKNILELEWRMNVDAEFYI